LYDEWGTPKKIETSEYSEVISDSGEIVITIETPFLKMITIKICLLI